MKLVRVILAGVLLLAMLLPLVSCTPILITQNEEETLEETKTVEAQEGGEYTPQAKKYKIKELDGYIKLIGERTAFASNDLLPLEWVGSGFELTLDAPAGGTPIVMSTRFNYASRFVVYVDGVRQDGFISLGKGNLDTVIANVTEGVHTVRVEKDTEQGTTYNNYNNIVSLSFEGTPMQSDQSDKDLYLEFIGDGYFVGFGALGNAAESPTISEESSYHAAVPALVAEALDADQSVVAHTSIGLKTTSAKMTLPQLHAQQNGYRDSNLYYAPDRAPDAIIIHVGTNDSTSSLPDSEFIKNAEAFIATLRSYYGDYEVEIPVVFLYGTLYYTRYSHAIQALEARNDNVFALEAEYGRSGSGAKGGIRYSSAAEHQKTADKLIPLLKELVGDERAAAEEND